MKKNKNTADLNFKKDLQTLSHLDRVPFYFLEKLIQEDDKNILKDLALHAEALFGDQGRAALHLCSSTGSQVLINPISAPSLPEAFAECFTAVGSNTLNSIYHQTATSRNLVFTKNLATESDFDADIAQKFNIRYCWSHPVFDSQKKLVGLFCLYFPPSQFVEIDDFILMEGMIQIAGLAMERYLQRLAQTAMIQQIEASNERLTVAIQARNMGVFDWNIEEDILTWDDALCRMFGLPSNQFTGKVADWESILTPDSFENAKDSLKLAIQGEKKFDTDFRIIKNGEVRTIRGTGKIIHGSNGKAVRMVGVNWDITEQLKAEKIVLEERAKSIASNKMASLGEMASGIAHEINNPLAIIVARTGQAKSKIQKEAITNDELLADLDKIEATVHRIAKIIRGLKNFSRNGDADPFLPSSVHQMIEETLELCSQRFQNQGIEIQYQNTKSHQVIDFEIECRSTQISQVILNLLNNAFDAVSELEGKQWVKLDVSATPTGVAIRVIDSGKGISPELADRLMEPFFTTKEVGKGTGLGLSISRGIAEEHGGSLWINRDSEHTEFVLELPRFQDKSKVR